jgi:uncharacterized membrane protein YqgA involved in biofilm formation
VLFVVKAGKNMTGTIINVITVLVGSFLGILFGSRLPERLKNTVTAGLGLFTISIGISMFLKTEESLLKELSATYRFKILLDQSFLITLENQSKWAMKKKLTDQTKLPNYYNFLYLEALAAVKPENMTIIR